MKHIFLGVTAAVSVLILSACTGASATPVSHTQEFKKGQEDGCMTANGNYVKNSEMFRNNTDYYNGWFYGRSKCNK